MVGRVTKIKQATALRVPQSKTEVIEAIAEIGAKQREAIRLNAEMGDELAGIKQKYEEQALPLAEVIDALAEGVQIWCSANREELLGKEEKTKTANLASGDVKWRLTPPKVVCRNIEKAIEELKERKLKDFIRIKEELNKEMILTDPDAVKGIKLIKIEQKEEFIIEPFETKLEMIL
jgi:phage host-nuclease inhibitor protein Gam